MHCFFVVICTVNNITLKFDNLLAQYLYQHKVLNLPGVGIFEADDSVYPPADEKQKMNYEGIKFRNAAIHQPDDSLIEFIKAKTGKMRPLAISDLESYVMLAKDFLNIGKPLFIEGIGTLQKTREGSFTFTPGGEVITRIEELSPDKARESKKKSVFEQDEKYEPKSTALRTAVLFLGVIATVGIVVWGGYYFYSQNRNQEAADTIVKVTTDSTQAAGNVSSTTVFPVDSTQTVTDTTRQVASSTVPAPVSTAANTTTSSRYKFVLHTTRNKAVAMDMYNKLKPKIQLETKDSSAFRIVISLTATPSDTLRLKDSLRNWYWGNRPKVITIEQQ